MQNFEGNRHPSLLRMYQNFEDQNNHQSETQNIGDQKSSGEEKGPQFKRFILKRKTYLKQIQHQRS